DITTLYLAAQHGHLDIVKYLTKKGANFYAKGIGGKRPLDIAEESGNTDVVEFLKQVQRDQKLLFDIIEKGSAIALKRQINKVTSINVKDEHGLTPLHLAVSCNRLDVVKLL